MNSEPIGMPRLPAWSRVALGLLALRAGTAFLPDMYLWGLNPQRFLSPLAAWGWWGLCLASFHPAVASRIGALLRALGRALNTRRASRVAFALVIALAVLTLDDQTWFTGDFLLRRGGVALPSAVGSFAQTMPLERLLMGLGPLFAARIAPGMLTFHRAVGALAVLLTALAATSIARSVSKRDETIGTIAILIAVGGYLVTGTGLGRPAALLCACVAIVASRALTEGPRWNDVVSLGLVISFALLLHRAAILLVPCGIHVFIRTLRGERAHPGPSRSQLALLTLPVLILALLSVRLASLFVHYDLPHHIAGHSLAGLGQTWSLRTEPRRWLDLLNVCITLVPAAPIALAVVSRSARVPSGRVASALVLVIPWISAMLLIRPQQGLFRDLDVFAPAGIAFGALASLGLASFLDRDAEALRLAPVLATMTVVPVIQLLLLFHQPERGLQRIAAYASEAPARAPEELARVWDFLAIRANAIRDWKTASTAAEHAALYSPQPRTFIMEGIANASLGDYAGARRAFQSALARDERSPEAWLGLAGAALQLRDTVLADSALRRAGLPNPDPDTRARLARFAREFPGVWPGSAPP